MSVGLMAAAWKLDITSTDKLVLLALADWSNDDGACWPSMAKLSSKSGLTDRAIRASVGRLCEAGHLTRTEVAGKGVNYIVHPGIKCPPEQRSPRNETHETPERRSANTPVTTTPKEANASSGKRVKPKAGFELPADIPAEPWAGFVDMRKRIGKPLSPRAMDLAVAKLRALADDGWPPGAVLDQSTMNSWQSFYPIKDERNGQQSNFSTGSGLRGSRPDPAVDMYRRACAAIEAEGAAAYPEDHRGDWLSLSASGGG